MKTQLVLPALLCVVFAVAHAAEGQDCDALRAQVVAKFQARGVTAPNIKIAPASEALIGKTVGTCALGTKRLIYSAGASDPTVGSDNGKPQPSAFPSVRDDILTECKDGTMSVGGSCSRR